MSEEEEAVQYMLPAWDCPYCGDVNVGYGQDDLTGPDRCVGCGEQVQVIEP